MSKKNLIFLIGIMLALTNFCANACEVGHWIKNNINGGRSIELENGSVWQINPINVITTMLWLPITNIAICDNILVNTDSNETVGARQIQ